MNESNALLALSVVEGSERSESKGPPKVIRHG
jgi:hypothetical protein